MNISSLPNINQGTGEASSSRSLPALALQVLAGTALLLLIYRVVLMWYLPLADTTEARYGEIARLTVTHGFWLMPHIDLQTPFFAKPPLSTWIAAVSMSVFGLNAFAARLPSLLTAFIGMAVAIAFAQALGVKRRWLVLPVLASCPLFFISAGAVMTDAVQMSIVSAAIYFAWRAMSIDADGLTGKQMRRRWQLAFWTMVGIGALSKGLADWALIGLPLVSYAVLERRPVVMFLRLFNWIGVLIAMCIFIPWYAAAEYYNPGFLNYFIVGEHFSRFLIPGWKGDRYGIAHQQPLGMIWVFWIAAMLPWTGIFLIELRRFLTRTRALPAIERFLWCATLAPLVFFTFAHNIIWTYGLTAIVPFSALVARWLDNRSERGLRIAAYALAALSLAAVAAMPSFVRNVNGNSDRDLAAAFHQAAPAGALMIYRVKPIYSPHFYAPGQIVYQPDAPIAKPANDNLPRFVVVANGDLEHATGNWHVLFRGTRHTLIEE